MSRVVQPLLAIALFIGVGFVTRYYYRQWMETVVKEASTKGLKETENWKAVKGNFSDVKFDNPINMTPKTDFLRPPTNRGKG